MPTDLPDRPQFPPVEHVAPSDAADAVRGLVLVCDHASNNVPPEIGSLGLSEEDMRRHIAWDVGARGVTLGLACRLGAEAVLSTWSRLVIDPNRGEDDPTLVMKLYDGSLIPGNRQVGQAETERRLDAYHRPYHRAVDRALDRVIGEGRAPALVAIHSFTPQFRGRPVRPWHVGLLWDRDDRLLRPLLARLRAQPGLCVGDNEPYNGHLFGDSMYVHGTRRGIPHVLVEIRNDLIETADDQEAWAERLAPMLREAVPLATAPLVTAPLVTGAPAPISARDAKEDAMTDRPADRLADHPTDSTTELEAAVYRRLRDHLRAHPDVQNIDLMNLAGFCRNCLSRWYQEAAAEKGLAIGKDEAREIVYGEPYDQWRSKHQREASAEQQAAFAKASRDH
jgi:predicted N-formylglutamate amidohydrolase